MLSVTCFRVKYTLGIGHSLQNSSSQSGGRQVAGLEWQIQGLARSSGQEHGVSDRDSSKSSFRSWRFEGEELALPVSGAEPQLWLGEDWLKRSGDDLGCM